MTWKKKPRSKAISPTWAWGFSIYVCGLWERGSWSLLRQHSDMGRRSAHHTCVALGTGNPAPHTMAPCNDCIQAPLEKTLLGEGGRQGLGTLLFRSFGRMLDRRPGSQGQNSVYPEARTPNTHLVTGTPPLDTLDVSAQKKGHSLTVAATCLPGLVHGVFPARTRPPRLSLQPPSLPHLQSRSLSGEQTPGV